MKKFFTLIAAVALAASVNAQGTYAVQVGDKVNAGDKITSVKNVTLTYMENAGTAFADGKATDNWADGDLLLTYVVRTAVSWFLVLSLLAALTSSRPQKQVL